MNEIRVKTSDKFDPSTFTFDDFFKIPKKRFIDVERSEDSTFYFKIRGNSMYAVSNEMIPEILKNLETGDSVEAISYFTPDDVECIVCFINHTKGVKIINETSYDTYFSKKKEREELERIEAETRKLKEEANRIEKAYQEHKKAKFERDSNFIYPFFEEGCLLMTISKFATDEKKELVEILSLPYITPTEYVVDIIKKYIPSYENVHFKRSDIYYTLKMTENPFYYIGDGYEVFLSPILTHHHYGHHCNLHYKNCSPKAYNRYVWVRRHHHNTACDNCFLTAMNLVIPREFMKTFNITDHIISYDEIYEKYYVGNQRCLSISI